MSPSAAPCACGSATAPTTARTPTSCAACALRALNPLSGRYRLQCLECCVRLVRSTNPNQAAGKAMLALIEMTPGAPTQGLVRHTMKRATGP